MLGLLNPEVSVIRSCHIKISLGFVIYKTHGSSPAFYVEYFIKCCFFLKNEAEKPYHEASNFLISMFACTTDTFPPTKTVASSIRVT